MDPEQLRQAVAQIKWFHTIDLGHGVVTPGYDDTPAKLPRIGLPDDLSGRTVLDIGAYDGFFSFEAERRGAARVVATDWYAWRCRGPQGKAGFELARRTLGAKVEDRELDVPDHSPETVGVFDLVLFLGVLYHVPDPLQALRRVASVTGDQLILETHVDMLGTRRPAAALYPRGELNRDPTNWWGPNPAAVLGMLAAVGFEHAVLYSGRRVQSFWYRFGRACYAKLRTGDWGYGPFATAVRSGRMVFHAWKTGRSGG